MDATVCPSCAHELRSARARAQVHLAAAAATVTHHFRKTYSLSSPSSPAYYPFCLYHSSRSFPSSLSFPSCLSFFAAPANKSFNAPHILLTLRCSSSSSGPASGQAAASSRQLFFGKGAQQRRDIGIHVGSDLLGPLVNSKLAVVAATNHALKLSMRGSRTSRRTGPTCLTVCAFACSRAGENDGFT